MIFGLITLFIAIALSAVSAYYSILGLTAIFAAAALPIIVMGVGLEAGKVMSAVWLHKNWRRAELQYKLYLVPAVIFLMLLTSMGVFGFLSKAHLDQAVPSGDIAAKVALYDEKIQVQRDTIKDARTTLAQLDAAVNETMARSTSEQGAARSVEIRRSQAKDRARLTRDIETAQATITKLQEERAPIASQLRQVEAEVGPIKYVAALLYGDNANADVLEAAVRWVIILIVSVFDPLAIVLILAGTKQLEWARKDQEESEYVPSGSGSLTVDELIETEPEPISQPEEQHPVDEEKLRADEANALVAEIEKEDLYEVVEEELDAAKHDIEQLTATNAELATENTYLRQQVDTLIDQIHNSVEPMVRDTEVESEQLKLDVDALKKLTESNATIASLNETVSVLQTDYNSMTELYERSAAREQDLAEQVAQLQQEKEQIAAAREADLRRADELANLVESLNGVVAKLSTPTVAEPAEIEVPVEQPAPSKPVVARLPRTEFGTVFPNDPEKGDMYLRVDFRPSRLFKWNDAKWIEINKSSTDAYSFNDEYIQFLVDKLSTGEYNYDELTDIEQQQVNIARGYRG